MRLAQDRSEESMRLACFGVVVASALAVATSGCGPSCAVQPGACQDPMVSKTGPSAADDIVCVNEVGTGSHIAEPQCYRRSEIKDRRDADRAALERAQMNSNRPHHGKPGE
jgi:hypothetical protein